MILFYPKDKRQYNHPGDHKSTTMKVKVAGPVQYQCSISPNILKSITSPTSYRTMPDALFFKRLEMGSSTRIPEEWSEIWHKGVSAISMNLEKKCSATVEHKKLHQIFERQQLMKYWLNL